MLRKQQKLYLQLQLSVLLISVASVKPVSWYNVKEDDLNILDEAIFDDYVASKVLHDELEEMKALEATETDDVNTKNDTQTAIAIAFEDSQETQDASFYSQNSL
jgi:hypothetical protein